MVLGSFFNMGFAAIEICLDTGWSLQTMYVGEASTKKEKDRHILSWGGGADCGSSYKSYKSFGESLWIERSEDIVVTPR